MHATAMPARVTAVVIASVCVQLLLRMVTSAVSMGCQSSGGHRNFAPFSVHAREKIALSTPPAEQPAPKRVKTFVTSLHLVAPCDLRDVLVQTAQYCMTGNALSPGAVLVRWEGSTTSLDQLL